MNVKEQPKRAETIKRGVLICILALTELAIQVLGSVYYSQTPAFVWTFSNGILFMVPLMFGMVPGLLFLLPVAISELMSYGQLHVWGPLLHLAAFVMTVVALGLAGERIRQMPRVQRTLLSVGLFAVALVGEEALYHGLRLLVMQKPFVWEKVLKAALSPAVLPLAALLAYDCMGDEQSEHPDD